MYQALAHGTLLLLHLNPARSHLPGEASEAEKGYQPTQGTRPVGMVLGKESWLVWLETLCLLHDVMPSPEVPSLPVLLAFTFQLSPWAPDQQGLI